MGTKDVFTLNKNITYITIPADSQSPLEVGETFIGEFKNYATEQVDGSLTTFDIADVSATKPHLAFWYSARAGTHPNNERAMLLLWKHNSTRHEEGTLRGPVIITGISEGNIESVPEALIKLLLHSDSFKLEVKPPNGKARALESRYETWHEAYNEALDFEEDFNTSTVSVYVVRA